MSDPNKTVLYKETVTDLNNGYRELIRYFEMGDYAAGYLLTFEHLLSMNLPGQPLHNRPDWIELNKLQPLPIDPRTRISAETFDNYLWYFEVVMRSVGLIDKDPLDLTSIDDIPGFDIGGD